MTICSLPVELWHFPLNKLLVCVQVNVQVYCSYVVHFGGVGARGGQMVRHKVVVVEYPEYLLLEITGRLQYEQLTLL